MKRKWPAGFKKWFADVSDIPEDIISDVPRITLIGRSRLSVENHKGIIAFSENELILSTQLGNLKVTGESFVLGTIIEKEIDLEGVITGISFIGS
ncbi:sporulation protein YqfC [Sporolactobacillus shoreae]|uniref:Sporulation protein YqfC n=1 Tax=Sporolactobacillus shoreae TaxID=1465501 RepID=A0A4Z0GTP6_9BACL|nr:sporulation protein YqfC [Sporolactobacillus shoreae]TGA99582.1 sporulation protein YqfC [Sporolactobacillus shoreae]